MSLLGIALALVMLILQLGAMWRLEAAQHVSAHATELHDDLEHTLRLLVDAETGQRGFLLTGREEYLEPYDRALRKLPEEFRTIHALLELRPAQQSRLSQLDRLSTAKLDELRETIALKKQGEREDALAITNSDRGKRLLDDIRVVDAAMVDTEGARLARQRASTDRLAHDSVIASAAAAGLIIAAAVLLLLLARETRRHQELRIADLQDFAGRVAHDIRNPLTAVRLSIDVAKRRPADQRTPATLDRAANAVDRACRLVDGLLSFARAGEGPAEGAEANVGSVIRDVIEGARSRAAERGIVLEDVVETAPGRARDGGIALEVGDFGLGTVACSPGVLTSMVSNLVDNAIKYTGETPTKRVTVVAKRNLATTRIDVRDSGPGVPRNLRATIFDPHVRAPGSNEPGFGLGLATVRRLAEAHGGSAGLTENVPSGSIFWIEVPNAPGPRSAKARSRTPLTPWVRWVRTRVRAPARG